MSLAVMTGKPESCAVATRIVEIPQDTLEIFSFYTDPYGPLYAFT